MFEAALFRLDGVPGDVLYLALDEVAVEVGEGNAGTGEDGHVAIVEEVEIAGVVEDAGDVGGDEELVFAESDDDWWAEAGGDDLVGFAARKYAESEGSGKAFYGAAYGLFEGDGLAGFLGLVLHLFDEMSDDLRVGFGDEDVALRGEFTLEFEVVLDDAVVNDDDAPGAVAVGMGVLFGGSSVSGPSGMSDAVGASERMEAEHLFDVAQFAGGASNGEFFFAGAADGNASGIIAAIFETAQPLDDDGDDLTGANVTDDSAHRVHCRALLAGRVIHSFITQSRSLFFDRKKGLGRESDGTERPL
uniref:Uncharacterized protein n=1 Tax=mine drainage metagenome TaxID=410659 RepID=E6QK49_9ZZZZ